MAAVYAAAMDAWRADPCGFWLNAARAIDFFDPPTVAFDPSLGVYGRWFPDAVCNTCWNAVDRHVPVRGDQPSTARRTSSWWTKYSTRFIDPSSGLVTAGGPVRTRSTRSG